MLRRIGQAILLFLAWTIPGVLTVSLYAVFAPESIRRSGTVPFLVTQVVPWWAWTFLTPAIVWMARRVPLERERLRRALLLHFASGVAVACLYTLTAAFVTLPLRPANEPPVPVLRIFKVFVAGRAPIALFLYAAVVGITIAVDERKRRRERDLHAARLQSALAKAQLQALQMQLQPHFLFNTLHAISMLVEENPAAATRTIVQLGDLLRQTLALVNVPEISLREELDILRKYLEIEKTRFGDRLSVEIIAPENTLGWSVPSFLLQPLVENAMRHGIEPRLTPGRMTVRVTRSSSSLRIEVEDDGPGFGAVTSHSAGLGLSTTRERLAVLYEGHAKLECTDVEGGGARVTVTLPAHNV